MVAIGKRIIRQSLDYQGFEWWSGSDDDDSDLDDDDDDNFDDDDDDEEEEEEDEEEEVVAVDQTVENDKDGRNNVNYLSCSRYDISDEKFITWHLVESHGKLLMVKSWMHLDLDLFIASILQVEVLQADFDTGKWVPMANDFGGAQALFIGSVFSKSISTTCEDVAEGDIYFIETGEVFNIKTQLSKLKRFRDPFFYGTCGTWLFSPVL
jgi:hypothetical protein